MNSEQYEQIPVADMKYQWVTWLLVAGGWIAVHHLSVVRERQKEIREKKEELIKTLLEIEDEAIAFHQAPSHQPEEARCLVAKVARVSKALARAPFSKLKVESKFIVRHRKSITLRNFDQSKFIPQNPTSILISEITLATEELCDSIESKYAERYLSGWWQSLRL